MAENAGSVVVDLIVRNGQADAAVKTSAANFEAGAGRIGKAANDIERSAARSANATRNLGFQLSDVGAQLSGGQSPFIIFGQQAPQIVQALEDIASSGAKLGAVLKSIALPGFLAILSVFGPLIAQQLGWVDATDKGEKSTKRQRDAVELLSDALAAYAKVNGQAVNNDYVRLRLMEATTKAIAAQEAATRRNTVAQLEAVKAAIAADERKARSGSPDGNIEFRLQKLRGSIPDLDKQVADQTAKAAAADRRARVAAGARIEADNAANPAGRDAIGAAAARKTAAENAYAVRLFVLERQLAKGEITEAKFQQAQLAATAARDRTVNQEANDRKADAASRRASRTAHAEEQKQIREAARDTATLQRAFIDLAQEAKKWVAQGFGPTADRDWRDTQREIDSDQKEAQQATANETEPFIHDQYEKQQQNIRSLAELYESAFTSGTKGIVATFKSEMIKAISIALAKLTISKLGALVPGAGGLLSTLFGRASGGYTPGGRMIRVNEGASPGRVEGFVPTGSGKVIPLGRMGAASSSGGGVTVLQTVQVDARGAVMNDQFATQILARANQDAARISATFSKATVRAAPAALSRQQNLGTS